MAALIIAVGLVLTATIASVGYVIGAKRQGRPSRDLAMSVRLIDRILSYDTAIPSLPADLRSESERFVQSFYKEIEP